MYHYFTCLLFLGSTQVIICLFLLISRKPQKNVLYYSKILVAVALASTLLACIISTYCLFTVFSKVALVLVLLFLLCGSILLYVYCRWRVAYGNGQFEIRPCFRRKRVYTMGEICGISKGTSSTILHLQKGKLRLDGFVRNRESFIDETEQYYCNVLQKGVALPDVPDKLFHGYLQNPQSFVVLFLFLDLFFLACIAVSLHITLLEMHPSSDILIPMVLTDYSVQWEDDSLHILSPEMRQPYYLNHVKTALSDARYSSLCYALSKTDPLVVYVEQDNYEDAKQNDCSYLKIKAMHSQDGQQLVSLEEAANSAWIESRTGLILLSTILLLALAFECLFFYVVNRAPQYPRLFRLLVKENWRNI